jgi:hypothetical protein
MTRTRRTARETALRCESAARLAKARAIADVLESQAVTIGEAAAIAGVNPASAETREVIARVLEVRKQVAASDPFDRF